MTQYEIVIVGGGADALFCRAFLDNVYLHESWSTDWNGRFRNKKVALRCLEEMYVLLHDCWVNNDYGNYDVEPLMAGGCVTGKGVLMYVQLIDPRRNGK